MKDTKLNRSKTSHHKIFKCVIKNGMSKHISLHDIIKFSYQKYVHQWVLGKIDIVKTVNGMEPFTCQRILNAIKLRVQCFQKGVK